MSNAVATLSLSPIVARLGGAIVTVMSDPSAYVDGIPSKRVQIAVARIVEKRPELNVEKAIGQLLDLVMVHGLTNAKALGRLIDGFNLDTVELATNFLFDEGARGGVLKKRSPYTDEDRAGLVSVEKVSDLIGSLSVLADRKITDTDELAALIERLGGLDEALDMGSVTLARAFEDTEYDTLVSLEEAQEANEMAVALGEHDED